MGNLEGTALAKSAWPATIAEHLSRGSSAPVHFTAMPGGYCDSGDD